MRSLPQGVEQPLHPQYGDRQRLPGFGPCSEESEDKPLTGVHDSMRGSRRCGYSLLLFQSLALSQRAYFAVPRSSKRVNCKVCRLSMH